MPGGSRGISTTSISPSPSPCVSHNPDRDLTKLAPLFGLSVLNALNECWGRGLDPIVFEANRSNERQEWLYAQGRTRGGKIVTNARTVERTWHGYGTAVDVISQKKLWSASEDWWDEVASVFEVNGCAWGGRWAMKDLPHFQWAKCSKSPRSAPEILKREGMEAVWKAVGAI